MSLCLTTAGQLIAADPATEQKASIEKINQQIKSLSKSLNSSKSKRKTARDDLMSAEQELSENKQGVLRYNQEIKAKEEQKTLLKSRLAIVEKTQDRNRMALNEFVLSRYKNGQEHFLKLLLNQQNPYAVGRLSNYNAYFSHAITDRLTQIQLELAEISTLEQQYEAVLNELQTAKSELAVQQKNLETSKRKRKILLATLDKEISRSSDKINDLKADRQRLDSLIKQIAKQARLLKQAEQRRRAREAELAQQQNRKPVVKRLPVAGGFNKQKRRLQYPSSGKKVRSFGSRIAASGMTSDGVFFSTKENQAVRSIYQGRVLFSDFLKGYGLLLIVDHGDNHISLYGHNEVLLKSVGDEVSTNEIISRSGLSGGLKSPGLYFEIRHNANPVDPSKWCQ